MSQNSNDFKSLKPNYKDIFRKKLFAVKKPSISVKKVKKPKS